MAGPDLAWSAGSNRTGGSSRVFRQSSVESSIETASLRVESEISPFAYVSTALGRKYATRKAPGSFR